jgi:ribosomal protein S18 acetylase RimI-like enzyme
MRIETVIITELKQEDMPETAELLAQAYMNNPNHVAIFGKINLEANRRMFGGPANDNKRRLFIASIDGKIVGVTGITKYPLCVRSKGDTGQPPPWVPESALPLFLEWMSAWNSNHLMEDHYHLGPVAVLPDFQRRHIGSQLMEYCCRILDREAQAGYLETETKENVIFYRNFGFEVVQQCELSWGPNWFMKRPAKIE